MKDNKIYLEEAIKESKKNEEFNYTEGGPFGAVIVKNGKIISRGHNQVLKNNDPTAHAEICAIRNACQVLGTYDLSDCTLYTNAEPCPMCLSAIIWSNMKEVYYANTAKDAKEIGFRDDMIYDFIKSENKNESVLKMHHIDSEEAKKVFEDFKKNQGKIMY